MDIMLTINGIRLLANVIIANPTCVNLVLQANSSFLGSGYNDCKSSKSCVKS
jgi:hypothetical protein